MLPPPLPEWLELDEVLPLMPSSWDRETGRNILKNAGVTRKVSRKRVVVVSRKLREVYPELHAAAVDRFFEGFAGRES